MSLFSTILFPALIVLVVTRSSFKKEILGRACAGFCAFIPIFFIKIILTSNGFVPHWTGVVSAFIPGWFIDYGLSMIGAVVAWKLLSFSPSASRRPSAALLFFFAFFGFDCITRMMYAKSYFNEYEYLYVPITYAFFALLLTRFYAPAPSMLVGAGFVLATLIPGEVGYLASTNLRVAGLILFLAYTLCGAAILPASQEVARRRGRLRRESSSRR